MRCPNKGGRNNNGRITVRFQGGGHKRRYRLIDFKRDKYEVPAKVVGIEYDPNRSANIALLSYADGEKRYILAPAGLNAGDQVITSDSADIKPGNCLRLSAMPMGTVVHGIEMKPGKGAQMVRSAGTSAQLMAVEAGYALLRLQVVKCVRYLKVAERLSGLLEMQLTRILSLVKLVVAVGSVVTLTTEALP